MKPTLVYLHIPKSAGTSYRYYFTKAYGKENVFWHGLDGNPWWFRPKKIASKSVIGGHKTLSFYPKKFDALYAAVVRDPVERVASYFNYCTTPGASPNPAWRIEREKYLKNWQKHGVCSSSLAKSIRNSKKFRKAISNTQCAYLSRYGATLEGVHRTLKEEKMVIGAFDQLSGFDHYLQSELGLRLENQPRANVGHQGYTHEILSDTETIELVKALNQEDQALYDFIASDCAGLYDNTAHQKR
jgi:hypothetical protein